MYNGCVFEKLVRSLSLLQVRKPDALTTAPALPSPPCDPPAPHFASPSAPPLDSFPTPAEAEEGHPRLARRQAPDPRQEVDRLRRDPEVKDAREHVAPSSSLSRLVLPPSLLSFPPLSFACRVEASRGVRRSVEEGRGGGGIVRGGEMQRIQSTSPLSPVSHTLSSFSLSRSRRTDTARGMQGGALQLR